MEIIILHDGASRITGHAGTALTGQGSVCRTSHGKIRSHSAGGYGLMSSATQLGVVNGFNYFFLPKGLLMTVILGFFFFMI